MSLDLLQPLHVLTVPFGAALCLAGVAMAVLPPGGPASALEPGADEPSLLSACEERLCRQVIDGKPDSGQLTCDLEKTWGKHDIKKGAKTKKISWGFGDARCSVKLDVARLEIVRALTLPKYEFSFPRHHVDCTVETRDGPKPLRAALVPKLKFKDGRVYKIWIRLKDIDGPEPLSSFVWTTTKFADTFGLFHSEMVKEVNKFLHRKCADRYGKKSAGP